MVIVTDAGRAVKALPTRNRIVLSGLAPVTSTGIVQKSPCRADTHVVRHDREADVVASGSLAMRPRDEPLEPFDRRRRRRNEARHFFGREHREK